MEKENVEVKKSFEVGDIVKFGKLHTDSNRFLGGKSDKVKDIEWRILDITDGKALMLSKLAVRIHYKMTASNKKDVTWETCDLRNWLNKDFYRNNFGSKEKDAIVLTKLKAEASPDVTMDSGNDTEDRVFLLSILEAEKYFENNEDREKIMGEGNETDGCWLRTLSRKKYLVNGCGNVFTYVDRTGSIHYREEGSVVIMIGDTESEENSVYPAMWVDLSKM